MADPPKPPADDSIPPLPQRTSNATGQPPLGMLSGLFPKSAKAPFSWAPDPPPSAPQSEGGPLPKTWREAIPYVVWVVLVLGFGLEFVAALVHGEWVRAGISLAGLVALMAAALHWNQIRSWIARTNPNWLYPGLLVLLLAIILFPFIEEKRWPLSAWFQTSGPPIVVHDPPTAEDIEKAFGPMRAERDRALSDLSALARERDSLKEENQRLRQATAPSPPYRNEMGMGQTVNLFEDFRDILRRDSPNTLILTAADDDVISRRFKEDFRVLLLRACSVDEIRCDWPDLPNSKTNLDAVIPAIQIPGIVVHQDENSPSRKWGGPNYVANILRCFIVHDTSELPRGLERLKATSSHHVLWFQFGRGSPWTTGVQTNEQCAALHGGR